jgi:lysophospholipase L1-like esterase
VITPTPLAPEEEPPQGWDRASAARAIAVTLGALFVAALLNAVPLASVAEQQPDGWQRDVAVGVAKPLRTLATTLSLDAPRRALDHLVGNDIESSSEFGGGLDITPPTLDRAPPPRVTTSTLVPTTTTTLAPRRVPTPDAPVRVLFSGDSLIGNIADGFSRATAKQPLVDIAKDVQVSTGLARPDVLDWPTHLQVLLKKRRNPEVVLLMFGGNDDQPLREGEKRFPLFTAEWEKEYHRRVGLMMDIASQKDRTVVWIAMPVVQRDRLRQASKIMNRVAKEEAKLRPRVHFYNPNLVLAPDGIFTDVVPGPNGPVDARTDDGVHVSQSGADLLAASLYLTFAKEWHLVR